MVFTSLIFFSLRSKLLVLVLSSSLISIAITTILFLNFENISIFKLEENIIGIGIVLMIGISITTVILSKRLSDPITRLNDAANKVSKGNFDVKTNITTHDEIGQLSKTFDEMAKNLLDAKMIIKHNEDVIKQQEGILLKFTKHTQNDCVGVIDMKDSTKISAQLSDDDVTKLYEIFLNFMAKVVLKYNGQVIKTIGDALLFRFANIDPNDSKQMKNVLECCLDMIESHNSLKEKLLAENMPELNYKISVTYGSVSVAQSSTSIVNDIFGPTVNRCFKINSNCSVNSMIIGGNMHEFLKDFQEYKFEELSNDEMKQKYGYTIFKVRRK